MPWGWRMKKRANEIYEAVRQGRLSEPFGAKAVKLACPGWPEGTYRTFLPKHAEGNPGGFTELFVRVARGLYRCKVQILNGGNNG